MPFPAPPTTPNGLTVDRRPHAFGIDNPEPEFGWSLSGSAAQSSYEIEVAADPSFSEDSMMWRSGRIEDSRPFGVRYSGAALESTTTYYWRVRLATTDDPTHGDWAFGEFETGVLDDALWKARWISHPSTPKGDDRTLYFRKNVELSAPVVRGRAYATALGWYRLFVNDQDLTGPALVPRWTPFHEYVEYQAYDVTASFSEGSNSLAVVVAEGRFRGRLGAFSRPARYGTQLAAFVQVELDLADGSHVSVTSDGSWSVGTGRISTADPKDGERVDLRQPELPWTPGQRCSAEPSVELPERRRLIAEEVDRVTEFGRLPAQSIVTAPSGRQIIDFGQNISGVARVRLAGPAGEKVSLLYSEVLDEDGEIATAYLDMGKASREWFQRDEAVLAEHPVTYTPWFTIHGFRYLCIDGPASPVSVEDVEAVVMSTPLTAISHFRSSDERLNRLHENVRWSLRSNFTDTATDCPTRERSGWTGDIQVFGSTAAQLVDADAFLRRYLRNLAVEQHDDGTVPPFIPAEAAPGHSRNVLDFTRTSTGWGDVAVLLPWTMYRYYGDAEVLRRQYPSAKAWVDQLARRARRRRSLRRRVRGQGGPQENFIVDTGYHWGEWLRPGESLSSELPGNLLGRRAAVATAYLAHSAGVLGEMAAVLGADDDSSDYRELAEMTAAAWRTAFVREQGRRIGDDRQDDYVRALAFDLVPSSWRPAVLERLVELVEQADFHLGTGFLSTPMLLGVLVDGGRADIAYRILLQPTAPSWIDQIEHGATTTWETWEGYSDGRPVASHNHYAFGAVAAFLQERVAGLAPTDAGYRRFRIAPVTGGALTWASVAIDTPYGIASSDWRISDGQLHLTSVVPPGTEAEVAIGRLRENVGPGTHHFSIPIESLTPVEEVAAG